MQSAKLLQVSDLSVRFGKGAPAVVDTVSFAVGAGETLAVVGESGSGKSVTALAVMGLLPVTALVDGTAQLAGSPLPLNDVQAMAAIRGTRIAMIFQEPMASLNPVLSVGRQLCETLRRHRRLDRRQAQAVATELLERVRIPAAAERLKAYPHELSGGMAQRVMIAIALAGSPELMIADEPTTALDVTVQAHVLSLLKDLQEETGMGLLFITHDMGVVAGIADRVHVMRGARSVETGPSSVIFGAPTADYTRRLIAAVPRLGALAGRKSGPVPFASSGSEDAGRALGETKVLEVESLTTRFDVAPSLFGRSKARVFAVENVTFDVAEGETLSLVGESGSGKSTVARSVLRLAEPQGGTVRFLGIDLTALDRRTLRAQRRKLQMVFQDPYSSLNPRMSVGAALAEPLLAHGIVPKEGARSKVAALLRQVGLEPDAATRFPHAFSGGQRQRICIARALAAEPRLLIADEAVSALDVQIKAQITDLLIKIQRATGIAILFISHDMALVERISHRVAVMYRGEIVEIGPTRRIVDNAEHPYTRSLLEAVPIPDPAAPRPIAAMADLVPSPINLADYQPPARTWREIHPGHRVMVESGL